VRRIRWLKREEADRLLGILPPHQAALVRFSLATGLRERNVTRLEWSQVDLTRRVAWIHPDQAKAKKPIGVPLNDEAMVVLRAEEGKHDKRVFTWQGRRCMYCRSLAAGPVFRWFNATRICRRSIWRHMPGT
jgi:integrase